MKYKKIELESTTASTVETEIMFNVASARASDEEVLLILVPDAGLKLLSAIRKKLKLMKKQGRIQLFVNSEDLARELTEARYLRNKYPNLVQICSDGTFIVIKV